MTHIFRRIVTSKALWIVAALLLIYALIGFFLAPYLIERAVPGYFEKNLGAKAVIGKVRLNPFLLRLEANDFRLEAETGRPLVAFNRLSVGLGLATLWRLAWTFTDVQLDGLQLNAEIGRDGRFNFAELAEHWSKARPGEPEQSPPRVVVAHSKLQAATLTFSDFSKERPASVKSDEINLELTELATIPDPEGRYTIAAELPAGGTLSWHGQLSLQPIASNGELRIEGVKLATMWPFFREELRIAEPRGSLSVEGRYDFSYGNGAAALALQNVRARVAALSIAHEGEQLPVLALDTIEATDMRYDLAKNELIVPRLKLANGTIAASLSTDDTLDWQELYHVTSRAQALRQGRAESPFHGRVEATAIDNVGLHFTDRTHAIPVAYAAALHAEFGFEVTRNAETTDFTADGIGLTLTDASVTAVESKEVLSDLKSIAIAGGHLDTAARAAVVDALAIKDGHTVLTRAEDGHIALLDAFSPQHAANRMAAAAGKDSGSPWKYVVHAADVAGVNVALSDHSYTPPAHCDVEVTAAVKNVASDDKSPIELKAALRVAQGGTINGSGTLAQDFKRATFKLDAAGIAAQPLRPVLARYANLDLQSGTAAAAARLEYRSGGKPELRIGGDAKLLNVLVNETDTGDRFLSWKTLTAENITLTITPNSLLIKEIRIEEPGAKIAIAKDRSVNVMKVLKAPTEAQSAAPSDAPSEPFPLQVARVALRQGTLDFADNSLVLPFATRVESLDGAIVGLSSSPKSRAELKLDGRIDPNGSASAAGSLEPADPKSFLDINVKFENVEMQPLSPYTATFAGREVAAGVLSLDLQYKIVDSQLLGENRITMANFKLGERVQAPNALDLPLDLAIALLREPDGHIHLAVPVRGDVSNPSFEYGVVIREAILNFLKQLVTAPFRLLAGLAGGKDGEGLENVAFDPGIARLTPPMREQLQKVAKALQQRPQLKLVVHGAYDPQRDALALRNAGVRREVAQTLGVKLQTGEDPGPLAYDDPETQRALEKMLSVRAGGNAVEAFAAEYAKTTGKEARRVNLVLAMVARGGGDGAFYEALFERLVQTEPLPDAALADLATQRARAIADFVAQAGVDPGRIEVGKTQTVTDQQKPVAATLALDAG